MDHIEELAIRIHRSISQNSKFVQEREERLKKRQRMTYSSQNRNRIAQLTSEKARFYMAFKTNDGFGSGTPRWTIPSSRKPPPPPDPTPDPGEYNIPTYGIQTKNRGYSFTRSVKIEKRESNDCEVMPVHQFPDDSKEKIKVSIASKSALDHFYLPYPDSPTPNYLPQPFCNSRPVTIGSKYRNNGYITDSPGPAKYTPNDAVKKKPLPISFGRAERKCYFDDNQNDNPGPGSYDVSKRIRAAPKWTGRNLERTKRFQQLYENHERPWAVQKTTVKRDQKE